MIQLEKHSPVVLIILDGFGYRKEKDGNAIALANMTTWQYLVKSYPHMLLGASEKYVGLPEGFMGNSEVGHLCLGAGRVVRTSFCKFHDSIDDKSFFSNELLINKLTKLKEQNRSFHIMGLLSDAGVHGYDSHIYALIRLAKSVGIKNIFIHAFLDGRDTPPKSAGLYLKKLQDFCDKEHAVISSIHGRFYAMDRDNNWDRVKKSYDVICGNKAYNNLSWQDVIDNSYKNNITDEFIEPELLAPDGVLQKGDGIFFTNFRPDRAKQLAECFLNPSFDKFSTCGLNATDGSLSFFISSVRYSGAFKKFSNDVLFEDEKISHTLLDEIASQTDDRVFVIAETEKYAHVTYFFRGKVDVQLPNETRVLVPSKKVITYADDPEMSAPQITQKILESLKSDSAYFYLVNYANCDMVGHSGNLASTVKACECVDRQLKILYEEVVEKQNGTIFVVGDHGNAEEMVIGDTKKPKTSHTTNRVPFVIINKDLKGEYPGFDDKELTIGGGVANVAPTILTYMGLRVPDIMDEPLQIESSHPE